MTEYHIYSMSDGLFTGSSISCSQSHLDANVPDGCSCLPGAIDYLSQRVDLATGLVIDYQPPQPSINHVWNTEKKRWLYVPTDADIAGEVRARRDRMLDACDWIASRASDGIPAPESWQQYRTDLRNISAQAGFPRSITWPVAPN